MIDLIGTYAYYDMTTLCVLYILNKNSQRVKYEGLTNEHFEALKSVTALTEVRASPTLVKRAGLSE